MKPVVSICKWLDTMWEELYRYRVWLGSRAPEDGSRPLSLDRFERTADAEG